MCKKKELVEVIRKGTSSRLKNPKSTSLKTIFASWKVYKKDKKRFVVVRSSSGGGCINIKFKAEATKDEVIHKLIDHFWNSQKGVADGKRKDSFNFWLTDAKDDPLSDFIESESDGKVPFTIGHFCAKWKMARPKLYLYMKEKSIFDRVNVHHSDDSDSSLEEIPLPLRRTRRDIKPFDSEENVLNQQGHLLSNKGTTDFISNDSIDSKPNGTNARLIGTSNEREELKSQIDLAYQESLSIDQEKQRLHNLMQQRKDSVKPAPSLADDHELVRVRHPILGNVTRLFYAEEKMQSVYNWVGSLNPSPEFFELINFEGNTVYPDQKISSGILNLKECEKQINLSVDGEVGFGGFAPIGSESSVKALDDDSEESYIKLSEILRKSRELLKETVFVTVHRDAIFEDMIKSFKRKRYAGKNIMIDFVDEDAGGDGVTKDAFSLFFESMYEYFEGEAEKVPSVTMNEETLVTIGQIINHAFIGYGVFPVKVCKVAFKNLLFDGTLEDEELYSSFLNFLPDRERMLIETFHGKKTEEPAILDILSESKIFVKPTMENIKKLCVNAAKNTLISSSFFSMKAISKGMEVGQGFWNTVDKEMVDAIFSVAIPTASKIIAALEAQESRQKDQQITTWLHRYLRSSSESELQLFMRFISGSMTIDPRDVIMVQFTDMPQDYLRPMAETCFKILHLPRGFSSFSQFRQIFNKYIRNQQDWNVHNMTI